MLSLKNLNKNTYNKKQNCAKLSESLSPSTLVRFSIWRCLPAALLGVSKASFRKMIWRYGVNDHVATWFLFFWLSLCDPTQEKSESWQDCRAPGCPSFHNSKNVGRRWKSRDRQLFIFQISQKSLFCRFFFFVATTLKVMRFSQACAPSLSASFDV